MVTHRWNSIEMRAVEGTDNFQTPSGDHWHIRERQESKVEASETKKESKPLLIDNTTNFITDYKHFEKLCKVEPGFTADCRLPRFCPGSVSGIFARQ